MDRIATPDASDFADRVERVRELMQDNFDGVILCELLVEAMEPFGTDAEKWKHEARFWAELRNRLNQGEAK